MFKFIKKLATGHITISERKAKISETREMKTSSIREMKPFDSAQGKPATDSFKCPYCLSTNLVKRGFRKKRREQVQLYLCKNCRKTFTPHITKGKHYPLATAFDAISLYNLGHSLEKACEIINARAQSNFCLNPSTLSSWLAGFSDNLPYLRMRDYAMKKYSPANTAVYATLAHQQLFRYRFHRAKCELIIGEDFKHRRFGPLQEFLEMVPGECPHQYFMKGLRASEAPMTFSKKQMIVRAKQNYANRLCQFVLQSVKNRQIRHEALQKFMLFNDSVTVATEVPVYLTRDDLDHLRSQLGFRMYQKDKQRLGMVEVSLRNLPKIITGHIDLLQIRNGQIHILDYKPKAEKERPIEQLTLYAMALSRLTGLRLFEFKCAWFDENDYFEFYPLHVLHKPNRRRRRKKIVTDEGTYLINQIKEKIERLRPL